MERCFEHLKTCPSILQFLLCHTHLVDCIVSTLIGLEPLLHHLLEELQSFPCHPTLSTGPDQCSVGDLIGLESLVLHLIKELQGRACQPTLSTCIDQGIVGDDIGLESLALHLIKELQGPL